MSISVNTCDNCICLQSSLIEKDCEIRKLEIQIRNLNEYLLFYKTKACQICHCSKNIKFDDEKQLDINFSKINAVDQHSMLPDNVSSHLNHKSLISDRNFNDTANALELKNSKETEDQKFNISECADTPNSSEEYVYDNNYKMYYCVSTGYYFDKNSGLYYVPQNKAYYSYDYSKKAYVLFSENKTDSETNCNSLHISQTDNCKSVELNSILSEDHEVDDFCESVVEKDKNENKPNSDVKEILHETESKEDTTNSNLSKAWEAPLDSNLTIKDLVREVAEQNSGMSDYVFDEISQMYFSQSTGYYYDSVRKLLYDPQNGIYYQYNEETASYDFYYQIDLKASTSNYKPEKKSLEVDLRVKARRRYWRKKQAHTMEKVSNKTDCIEAISEENYSSPEEGELFSSDSEEEKENVLVEFPHEKSTSSSCSPCIRAIVKNSEKLKIGSLILITCAGGVIGRNKCNAVCLCDTNVSKVHAEVIFDEQLWKYCIKDLGSQNGTYVNDKRLSQPKECSSLHILNHGDNVVIGSCKLVFHIHVGYETCDECEPGQVMAENLLKDEKHTSVFKTKEEKEKERRKEVKRLKKKYGLEGMNYDRNKSSQMTMNSVYEDKAEMRRQTVGSENPYEKTEVSSMERSMDESNKGYQMLKKLGWNEGDSLGLTCSGISEPIPLRPWLSKAGLGSTESQQISMEPPVQDKRNRKWIKAQERFLQL